MRKLLPLCAALLLAARPGLAAPDPAPAAAATAARPAPVATPEGPTRGLMRYDTNKDGAVDRAEWQAGQEARFRSLDSDRDGRLTQEELFARTPAQGNSVLTGDRQAQRQTAYFQLLDADRDGTVTLAEFLAQAERNFARCDVDGNGRIDVAECRQALQPRSRAQR